MIVPFVGRCKPFARFDVPVACCRLYVVVSEDWGMRGSGARPASRPGRPFASLCAARIVSQSRQGLGFRGGSL